MAIFVVLSKFTVDDDQHNLAEAVKAAFQARPHLVDDAAGFVRLDVLTPVDNTAEIWLLTYWADEANFQAWYRTHAYQAAHAQIPPGLRLIGDRTAVLFFQHVAS